VKATTWARSLVSPRERLLPGLGARLERRPQVAASVLVALRRAPGRERVYRNVSQPLARRMGAALEVPVSGGSRMRVDTGDLVGSVLAISGRWEPNVTALFRALLRPGNVCIDVGANIGYFTLLASRLVGPDGRVHAFEPEPAAVAALEANVGLNHMTNVAVHAVAAGESEREAVIGAPPPGNAASASLAAAGEPGSPIRVRRVDAVVPAQDLRRARLVKIDVEGAEADVLHGLEPAFEAGARPAVIVELHPAWWDDDTAAYLTEFCNRLRLVPWTLRIEAPTDRGRYVPTRFDAMQRHPEHVLLVPRSVADGGA
jgi:FkbM family methyltransferase